MTFNKQQCIDNIYTMAKATGKKIGDLEEKAGVSRGYLSRISKPDAASPSIETLTAVATELGVSVDYLLFYDSTAYSKSEKVMLEFLDSLLQKSISKDVEWATDSVEGFCKESYQEFKSEHPLFDVCVDTDDYGRRFYSLEFCSRFDSRNTAISSNCFHTNIDHYNRVYLMVVHHTTPEKKQLEEVEMYICDRKTVTPLCCTYLIRDEIAKKVHSLVGTIRAVNSNISIDDDTRYILEKFIRSSN